MEGAFICTCETSLVADAVCNEIIMKYYTIIVMVFNSLVNGDTVY